MGTLRLIPMILALLAVGAECAQAQSGAQSAAATLEGPINAVNVVNSSTVMLPCTPVAAYWTGPPQSEGMPPGPELAIVSINVRPKDARVHLDDRFVGRARYLDGKPGYLYLEPGSYDLELRFEGYRTLLVELDARVACRYDLKHRLERSEVTSSGGAKDTYGKGKPFDRVYGPRGEETTQPVLASDRSGPDPTLRHDLDRHSDRAGNSVGKAGASLRLRVKPQSASVFIDGEFVATGRELALMQGPLATTAGQHDVVVRAPGFDAASQGVELDAGEILELEISLPETPLD